MVKLNTKNLVITILLGVLFTGITGTVRAQQVLPRGGDSIETAVMIEPGSYEGGSLDNKEVEFFYVEDIEFGQRIDIEGIFTADNVNSGAWAILALYDEDGIALGTEESGFNEPLSLTISQMYRDRNPGRFYIQVKCDLFKIASYSLDVLLTEAPVEIETLDDTVDGDLIIAPSAETGENEDVGGASWELILCIIGVVAVIGIIAFLFLKKKKKSSSVD